jgi:ferritin-like metal-binding protein YciE
MLDSAHALLEDLIKDLYSAEKQLLKALPKMAKAATTPDLKRAFQTHLKETEVHVERLAELADMLDIKPGGKKCEAMAGLIAEGQEVMGEDGDELCIDAALIGAAQKVEHYEISAYGTARTVAQRLGRADAAALLEATLEEEKATDEKLTGLSTEQVLPAIPIDEEDEVSAAPAGRSSRRR